MKNDYPDSVFNWKRILLALAALTGTAITFSWLLKSMDFFANVSDLPEFFAASWLACHGQGGSAYDLPRLSEIEHQVFPALGGRAIGFYLSPPALLFLMPLALVAPHMVQPLWFVFLLGALLCAFGLLVRFFSISKTQSLLLWTLIIIFGPTYESLRLGQLSPLILLSLVGAFCLFKRGRDALAAFCLSLLVIKPQLLIPYVVFLLAGGRSRAAVYLLGFVAFWLSASFILVGSNGFGAYFSVLKPVFQDPASAGKFLADSPTFLGQLLRLAHLDVSLIICLGIVFYILSLAAIFLIAHRFRQREDWLSVCVLCVAPLAVIGSPYLQDYDLMMLLPSITLFVRERLYAKRTPAFMLFVLILNVVLLMPYYSWLRYGWLLGGFPLNPFFVAVLVMSIAFSTSLKSLPSAPQPQTMPRA